MKTILIQGAMESEISYLIDFFKPNISETQAGFGFLIADYKNAKIIISLTQKGIINASEATTIGILKYRPDILINQGCAGSSREDLVVGDILIGETSVYINDFRSEKRAEGEGSNSLEWTPNPKRSYRILASDWLLDIAKEMSNGDAFVSCLGSGDLFSRENDRISYLRECFSHDSEDMETVAVYKICEDFNIPHISFRIISNNELLSMPTNKSTYVKVQEFTVKFIEYLLK